MQHSCPRMERSSINDAFEGTRFIVLPSLFMSKAIHSCAKENAWQFRICKLRSADFSKLLHENTSKYVIYAPCLFIVALFKVISLLINDVWHIFSQS